MNDPPQDAVARCIRTLLSLADVQLRIRWLSEQVRTLPPEEIAPVLDSIVGMSEVAEPRAREALMTIALWTVGTTDTRQLTGLRQVALTERLLSLQRVIRAVPCGSQPPQSHKATIPDYGKGRELTLGERRSLARCSDRSKFDALLKDPHPMVIRQLLINPKVTEADVVRLTAHRPARPALIEAVACTSWLTRRRVRMTILFNPGSPLAVVLPLIGLSTRDELVDLTRGADLASLVRVTAGQLLDRRPPVWAAHKNDEDPVH